MAEKPSRWGRGALLIAGALACGCATTRAAAPAGPGESAIPFVGEDAVDAWGNTLKTVDPRVFRRLLEQRKYAELTRLLEAVQIAVEADCRNERWAIAAFEAVSEGSPEMRAVHDEWVRAEPASYAPLLSRGLYWYDVGSLARGFKWAAETKPEQFDAMNRTTPVARADLEASVRMHDTVTARRALIRLEFRDRGASPEERSHLDAGLQLCPGSLMLRTAYLMRRTPRWGGSYEEMADFAATAPVDRFPWLKVLAGFPDDDRCETLAGPPEDALRYCDAALALGPYFIFQLNKASTLMRAGRPLEALPLLVQADRQRPLNTSVLGAMIRAQIAAHQLHESVETWLTARELSSTSMDLKNLEFWLSSSFLRAVGPLLKQHRVAEAKVIVDEIHRITPDYPVTLKAQGAVQLASGDKAGALGSWRAVLVRSPQDFEALVRVEELLVELRRPAEAIELWTTYLSKPSPRPTAWSRRAAIHRMLGDEVSAKADLAEACKGGDRTACP